MKQAMKRTLIILSVFLLFSMLFSCNNGLTTEAKSGINLTIDASRAMVGTAYDRYYVECLGPNGAYVALNVKNTSASITDIVGGEWGVSVDAYIGDTLEAQGSSTVIVPENGSIDLEITLTHLNPTPTATVSHTPTATIEPSPTATIAAVEIVNPGAESGTTGWTGDGTTSDVKVNSGSFSFLLKHGNSLSQSITVTENTDYTLSAWAYLTKTDTTLKLSAAGASVNSSTTINSWKEVILEFNSGSASSVTLTIQSEGGYGWIYVDDLAISGGAPQPSPTSTYATTPPATATNTIAPTATYTSTATPTFTSTPTATFVIDGDNHVENGTFSNLDGWVLSGTVVAESGQAKLGTVSSSANYFTSKALAIGSMYQFKADGKKTSDAGWSGIGFHCLDAAGTQLYSRTFEVANTSMTSFSSYFEVPANAVNIEVWLYKGGTAGYLYADNIEIILADGVDPRPAPPAYGTRVWQEAAPGLVVIETESLDANPSQWDEQTADGESYQKFIGTTNTFGGVGLVPLGDITNSDRIMEFKVLLPRSGNYMIKMSNRHAKEDGDNDVWFWTDMSTAKDAQTNWAKFHDHNVDIWSWDESSDWIKPEGFSGGIYTLKYAGRSNGFKIDRIVIYDTHEYDITVDDSVLGSATESYYTYGVDDPDPTPSVSPSPTPTIVDETPTVSPTAPVDGIAVDGSLADWDSAPNTAVSKLIYGSGTADVVNYSYVANQSGLYVGVQILDATINTANVDKDSVEIYLDGDNISQGNPGVPLWALPGYGADEYQFIVTAGEDLIRAFKPGESISLPAGVQGASQLISGGYEVEAFIPWNVIGLSASSGTNNFSLGFDIGVNDVDTSTVKERQLMWYGTADNWKDSSNFGTLNVSFTTTDDNEAPSQVSNISVTPENPFYGDVTVSFDPASDNVGIASYLVELSNGLSQTITGTSCVFEGLEGETYYTVTVTASDAAGNTSLASTGFTTPLKEDLAIEPPPARVPVGTNFWNKTWGNKWEDYFKSGITWSTAYANNVNIWNTQFLQEIADAKYPTLRFMDWLPTNNNGTMVSWADRYKPTDDHYTSDGVAIEWMIDLCNRTNTNLWLNLPHKTFEDWLANPNDNFWTKAAALVRDNLDPGLKVYVEYSNETFGFGQATYVQSWGADHFGFDAHSFTAGQFFNAYAAVRLWKAFKDTFGADAGRVEAVMGGQMGSRADADGDGILDSNYTLKCHLLALSNLPMNYGNEAACSNINPWGLQPDVYAITSYIGGSGGGGSSNMVAEFKADVDETVRWAKIVQQQIYDYGYTWPIVAYEGGQHYKTDADLFSRDPDSYQCYKYWLEQMSGTYYFILHYTHTGTWKSSNAWGAKEFTGQSLSQAHKYRAILDWNNGN